MDLEAAIQTVPDKYPTFIIQIISCLLEHNAENDVKEHWCQYTTLLHTVDNEKGLRHVTIESDQAAMGLAQLDHHLQKLGGQSCRFRMSHIHVLLTESTAIVRSTKVA